jgi:parallel beta-helix repeat protein
MNLMNSQVSKNKGDGISVGSSAQVSLVKSQVTENKNEGIFVNGSAKVSLTDSEISGNMGGLAAGCCPLYSEGSRQLNVSLTNSRISQNKFSGLLIWGGVEGVEVVVTVAGSTIEKNGVDAKCAAAREVCSGIALDERTQMTIIDSTIKDNADWGIGAELRQCGGRSDSFTGKVIFEGKNVIEGNNKLGKLNGKSNPGNHPFKDLPDGQVCLP